MDKYEKYNAARVEYDVATAKVFRMAMSLTLASTRVVLDDREYEKMRNQMNEALDKARETAKALDNVRPF